MNITFIILYIVIVTSYASPPIDGIADNYIDQCSVFPYQISLQYGNHFLGYFHVCGGSIINSNWMLTAGHCIADNPELSFLKFRVVAGNNNFGNNGQISEVQKIVIHPNYKGDVNPNDIALIQLKTSLKLNDEVQVIRLPRKDSLPAGKSLICIWRSTNNAIVPIQSKRIQNTELPLMSYEECARVLTAISGDSEPLAKTNICTAPLSDGTAACLGDSGGPLITCDPSGPTVVGVVSWGVMPCGVRNGPSVYTRVSAFLDFINKHVQ